jgi:four helix bundle protein
MFRFETLEVWPLALEYVDACYILADKSPQRAQFSLGEQWRRAATSITANIAEGSAKSTQRSERNYYDMARGSVAETVALLALAHRRQYISDDHHDRMYNRATRISAMLRSLIQKNSSLSESSAEYATQTDSLIPIIEPLPASAHPRIHASSPPRLVASDPGPWQTHSTQRAFGNKWLSVEIDEVELPTGVRYEYTRLVPAAPGVGVIGFNEEGLILLEREYRHGVGEVIWQIPGGLADGSEDLRQAGLRELREETGYAPAVVTDKTVRYLGAVWDNPAFGPTVSHIYAAWELEEVASLHHDPGEFVTLHWITPEWLKEAVRNGEIKDRVVIAAVAQLLLNGWL